MDLDTQAGGVRSFSSLLPSEFVGSIDSTHGTLGHSCLANVSAQSKGSPTLRICAVACVKDTQELLQATMTHLALNGIVDFYLYDHGSHPDLASALSDAFGAGGVRVRILRKETTRFFHAAMVGVLTELARMDGFETVLAFDADEFWCSTVPGHTLADQISIEMTAGVDALRVPFLNYVQHRNVSAFRVDSLQTCRYSVVPQVDKRSPCQAQVDAGAPFVAMPFPSKVIARLARDVRFTEGQHNITTSEGEGAQAEANGIIVRHLPLSARGELAVKREHGLRRIEAGYGPETGWQLQRLAYMTEGELDAYWDNNSWRVSENQRVLVGAYNGLVEDSALVEIGRDLTSAIDGPGMSPNAGTNDADAVGEIGSERLERIIESLVDDVGKADRGICEREEHLLALQAELNECRAAATRLRHDLADLVSERARMDSLLNAVTKSASWRLTAPLRGVKRRLRG